jgi:hypothetical protein
MRILLLSVVAVFAAIYLIGCGSQGTPETDQYKAGANAPKKNPAKQGAAAAD